MLENCVSIDNIRKNTSKLQSFDFLFTLIIIEREQMKETTLM